MPILCVSIKRTGLLDIFENSVIKTTLHGGRILSSSFDALLSSFLNIGTFKKKRGNLENEIL